MWGCCDQDQQRCNSVDAVRNSHDSQASREAVVSFFMCWIFIVLLLQETHVGSPSFEASNVVRPVYSLQNKL
jgi:hypothetical protein